MAPVRAHRPGHGRNVWPPTMATCRILAGKSSTVISVWIRVGRRQGGRGLLSSAIVRRWWKWRSRVGESSRGEGGEAMGPIEEGRLTDGKKPRNSARKRAGEPDARSSAAKLGEGSDKTRIARDGGGDDGDDDGCLVFQDPFGDDFESEGEPLDALGAELRKSVDHGEGNGGNGAARSAETKRVATQKRIFRPGVDALGENEVLTFDDSAYDMLHTMQVEWPALSFDFLVDSIPGSRQAYPMSAYGVMGSQADRASRNQLVVLKLSQMHKTRRRRKGGEDDEDEDADEDEDEDDDDSDEDTSSKSVLDSVGVKHDGGINRVRSMPQRPNIVATWADTGRVNLFDVQPCLDSLDRGKRFPHPSEPKPASVKSFFSFGGHKAEGFAMDWSRLTTGRLLTGDVQKKIFLWEPTEDGRFHVDPSPFRSHTDSVEDLQWSPTEANVFASCSVDRSIRFWDSRNRRAAALVIPDAHDKDVNVLSWNRIDSHLLLSGGDEGHLKVWDLRAIKEGQATPAAFFDFHHKAITSVEWHPTESSMLAASSEDHTISLWDLAVERDPEEEARLGVVLEGADDLPPQLLFLHTGQKHVKEIHWHPQLPSVLMSTAEDGLNIFRPADVV